MADRAGPAVELFVSCLVDAVRPEVGEATVEVLRRAGCEVAFDPRQTCCGQPAFNTGCVAEARSVAAHFLDVYGDSSAPIVVPSGSCAAMIHRFPALFAGTPNEERAQAVVARTVELSRFLVHELRCVDLGGSFAGRVAYHDGCHGLRDLSVRDEPRQLLAAVAGLELVELPRTEACCGFGGTFAVKHPDLSVAMADRRLTGWETLDLQAIASGDVGCLLQLGGRLRHQIGATAPRFVHFAEVLVGAGSLA